MPSTEKYKENLQIVPKGIPRNTKQAYLITELQNVNN